MSNEDILKLCAGIGLVLFGAKLASNSLSGAGAVEYRGTTKKADQRNDRLLGCVDMTEEQGDCRKADEAHHNQRDQVTDVTARDLGVVGHGCNQGRQIGVDDAGPVKLFATFGNNFLTRFVVGVVGGCRFGFAHARSLKQLKLGNVNRNGGAA